MLCVMDMVVDMIMIMDIDMGYVLCVMDMIVDSIMVIDMSYGS